MASLYFFIHCYSFYLYGSHPDLHGLTHSFPTRRSTDLAKKTRNAGNGATSFHQDYITFAVDRTGGMTFWLALEDYGPEFGTMSFVNRSQNLGVIGSYRTYGGGDARDVFPECRERGQSGRASCRERVCQSG